MKISFYKSSPILFSLFFFILLFFWKRKAKKILFKLFCINSIYFLLIYELVTETLCSSMIFRESLCSNLRNMFDYSNEWQYKPIDFNNRLMSTTTITTKSYEKIKWISCFYGGIMCTVHFGMLISFAQRLVWHKSGFWLFGYSRGKNDQKSRISFSLFISRSLSFFWWCFLFSK